MGNREALLEGAKRCLLEKGYARTTARDIAEAAGVSLAAIGYHFGSKESLLEQAFMGAMEDWFDDGDDTHEESPTGSIEQFRAFFDEILTSFPERRSLLRLNMEMGLEGAHNEALGHFMAGAVQYGRLELAKAFQGLTPERDGALAQSVGSFYSVLMTGLVAQYLMDRENFPTASDLAEGLLYIAERLPGA
ncbi:TetR/AcrR family transcriptional regulator [Actinospica durhamensis]|uniref:TetR/AcrR family transcriptional regulator n=1 Tax=Actinospica durhamensis TaxID=1508375 RepID=A0A941ILH6_9ACTN|nr:TetR/AcrR family transcriptional regulator [Actinospica durhamensis]MBR7833025.1 TetR/AcrR family transcriptional regulator [Actinospica durhamensis]